MGLPFLNVLKNFGHSEKAIYSLIPLVIATVFVFTGRITEQEWMGFAEIIVGIYIGGKAVQGAAAAVSSGSQHKAEAEKAKVELVKMKLALKTNDAAADAALAEKFDKD